MLPTDEAIVVRNTIHIDVIMRHMLTFQRLFLLAKIFTIYCRVCTGGNAWLDRPRAIARKAREKGKGNKQQIYSRLRSMRYAIAAYREEMTPTKSANAPDQLQIVSSNAAWVI